MIKAHAGRLRVHELACTFAADAARVARTFRGPGSSDDIEPLFGEQTAHFLSEARVVVDDQATQTHNARKIAGTVPQHHWC